MSVVRVKVIYSTSLMISTSHDMNVKIKKSINYQNYVQKPIEEDMSQTHLDNHVVLK